MSNLFSIFQKYHAIVFFDTETTGLYAKRDKIIELAAIRVEYQKNNSLIITKKINDFIKLPHGNKIPTEIIKLTKITNETLENQGIGEINSIKNFSSLINDKNTTVLIVAYNAQFDLGFLYETMAHYRQEPFITYLNNADYLDALTVYKDRYPYPHKLIDAINTYKLQNKVKNSHRAIDDVMALFEVFKAMNDEKSNLLSYVNKFSFNPKYGIRGQRISKVKYFPQS